MIVYQVSDIILVLFEPALEHVMGESDIQNKVTIKKSYDNPGVDHELSCTFISEGAQQLMIYFL